MNNEIDGHISELLSFINLVDRGTFSGKDSETVLRLKQYFNEILSQLVAYKNQQKLGDQHEI